MVNHLKICIKKDGADPKVYQQDNKKKKSI